MNEPDSQHDLADELLSAYLDGELSPAERAAVEARLAHDPDAQQMLRQLRNVSQAVQRLPRSPAGADMCDVILQRVEKLAPTASAIEQLKDPATPAGEWSPKATVFRSRRSWVWASLAVAAALLIMVLERENEPSGNLPTVARRDGGPTDRPLGGDNAALRREVTVPLAAPAEVGKLASADRSSPTVLAAVPPAAPGAIDESRATPRLAPAKERDRPADESTMTDRYAASAAPPTAVAGSAIAAGATGGRASATPEVRGGTAGDGGSNSLEVGDELVVVHVVAKPEALQNKVFDSLLVSNGIDFEPAPPQEPQQVAGATNRPAAIASDVQRESNAAEPQAQGGVEMVLVDAPRPAIVSCLAGLQRDATNYVGIEVDERATASSLRRHEQKLFTQLGQYNRGLVTTKQKASLPNELFYRSLEERGQPPAEPETLRAHLSATSPDASDKETVQRELSQQVIESRGRALRFSLPAGDVDQRLESRSRATPESATHELPALRQAQSSLKTTAGNAADENLQVLFVLSPPDDSVASPASEKPPE